MKQTIKIIAYNFIVFSTIIVFIEVMGQAVYFVKNGSFLPFEADSKYGSQIFELHPYLVGRPQPSVKVTKSNKTITTTNHHTRWTGAVEENNSLIKIAVVGGSTTFGTGVTDEDSWPALLQTKLGKSHAVINYGVPGYSTVENIIQMAFIVPEAKPHFVIFYEGWNDIRSYHENNHGPDYYGHGMRQYGNLSIKSFKRQNKLESLENIFATVWLVTRLNKILSNSKKEIKTALKLYDTPDQFIDKVYIRNLNTLKLLAKNIDAVTVFVPQLLNYADYYGKEGSREWTRHIKDDAIPSLMDRFNGHLNGLCSQEVQDCIVLNEIYEANWTPDDFVDDGHLSRSGGLKFAEIVAQFIRSQINSVPTCNRFSKVVVIVWASAMFRSRNLEQQF